MAVIKQMMTMKILLALAVVAILTAGYLAHANAQKKASCDTVCEVPHKATAKNDFKVTLSDAEWQKKLSKEQYRILRQKGTERAFSGALWNNHDTGVYKCAGCGTALFASETKFESGTGWPSFYQPVAREAVHSEQDTAYGMIRTEVLCGQCGGHLGHVFDDGPKPTGLRYCINSASLTFEKAK